MVKDHSDSERGNPLPPHGLLFPINSKGSFICTIPHIYIYIGGGGGARGRHCNDFFHHIYCGNQKSNGGPMGGTMCE